MNENTNILPPPYNELPHPNLPTILTNYMKWKNISKKIGKISYYLCKIPIILVASVVVIVGGCIIIAVSPITACFELCMKIREYNIYGYLPN